MSSVKTDRRVPGKKVGLACRDGNWSSPVQMRRMTHRHFVELSICARPGWPLPMFAEQARYAYRRLFARLKAEGARPRDLVSEKVFLSDVRTQVPDLRAIRREFYLADGDDTGDLPAMTYVQQPPAHPGQLCEIQAFAILDPQGGATRVQEIAAAPAGATGKVVEAGGLRHVYLGNVTGGTCCDGKDVFAQALSMFEQAETCLRSEGLTFRDVQRTWIYLREMGTSYDALNRARDQFFISRGIDPAPASTGIQGTPFPPDRACALDLRAVGGLGPLQAVTIHSPTMNEAPIYGSRFSRGMRLNFEDHSVLYISGTASIDTSGRVVHVGHIEGQVSRMLLNVERLLTGQGAAWSDLISATTYLKRPEYLAPFRAICRQRGIPELAPHTICVADVCRPEWLCEMEAIAVLSTMYDGDMGSARP